MENHNTKINKKPLPWSPSKSEIFRIYVKLSETTIREEIWIIMAKHRRKSEDQIKQKKILFHNEFSELVKILGIPKDYYAPDGFFEAPL